LTHIAAIKKNMFANNGRCHITVTSATESLGKEELLGYIEEVNQEVKKNNSQF
jgi:GTP-binding protein